MVRATPLFLLNLAPGGGYLAACIAARAGGLLHRLFTMTPCHLTRGSLFSVTLFQQVAPLRDFPGTVRCGGRTFLGAPCGTPRPSG